MSLNKRKAPPLQSNPKNFRLGSHPLTDEQQHGLELAVTGESLKIEAGAGKTTPSPSSDDSAPLLESVKGRAGLSEGHIRSVVQKVFDNALERMRDDGFPDDDVRNLRSASLHWLRHTSATADAKVRDHKDLQADLRHESLATTVDTYYSSRNEERHRSNKHLSIEDR